MPVHFQLVLARWVILVASIYLTQPNIGSSVAAHRECLERQPQAVDGACGATQGSVLNPDIWNVPYGSLLGSKIPKGYVLVGVADIIVLSESGREHLSTLGWLIISYFLHFVLSSILKLYNLFI